MKIKPLHANVIIKPKTIEEVTKSGIVLPGTMDKERPEQGTVVAIGDGKMLEDGKRAAMSVKVGDIVLFKKYSPDEIKVDDEDLLVLSENEILAILD